jgi:fumarate hydratase class II
VIDGVEAQTDVLERNAGSTPAIATALNEHIGYDKATEIVKEAVASKRTIREETLDTALDLLPMARPHEQVTS